MMRSMILTVCLWWGASGLLAQEFNLKSVMSSADFEQCGLEKLTREEFGALEKWIASFGAKIIVEIEKRHTAATTPNAATTPSVIESQIHGDFEGWDGETLFILANGQVWQQASYAYYYHYAYRPKVLIVPTSSGWIMKVEGVSQTIKVERLR